MTQKSDTICRRNIEMLLRKNMYKIKNVLTHHLTKSHNGANVFMKSNLDKT